MTDDKLSCLLRRLTVCDGQRVVSDSLRAHEDPRCYCAALAAIEHGDHRRSALSWARARDVTRAARLQRAMELRQRLEMPRDF